MVGQRTIAKGCPILVICFTNHALDQFLESIVNIYPEGVVRLGSRSKSELLEPYNLSLIRSAWGQKRKFSNETSRLKNRYYKEFKDIERDVDNLSESLIWADKHVISERKLQNVIPSSFFDKFLRAVKINLINEFGYDPEDFVGKQKSSLLKEWLLVGPLRCLADPRFTETIVPGENQQENRKDQLPDENQEENDERILTEENEDQKYRREKRQKFLVPDQDVRILEAAAIENNCGWQVHKSKKLLRKMQHEAQTQIRLIENENLQVIYRFL